MVSVHKPTLSDAIYRLIVTLAVFSCNRAFPWVQTHLYYLLNQLLGNEEIRLYKMDNATGDNKNRFVFYFWSLFVANRIFREVYVNFMIVGHTHDDIDALFGRWSMVLKKESFPTILMLMKSFMDVEAVPTIPHLIEEVPDFKKFIEDGIADGENALLGHTKAQQFKFYVDASRCPVMKYKLLCTDDEWLPEDGGI